MAKPIPPPLTEAELKQIRTMGGFGMPVRQIAAVLGFSEDKLRDMMERQPEIKASILKGRSETSAQVRNTAFKMAMSGKCPAMTIFWLKVRERWKEPDHTDPSDDDEGGEESAGIKLIYARKSE